MEVCVDSVEAALNAEKGGAVRVELCSNLMEGGTTPSLGMFKIIKQKSPIPVFVMIRPRGGDFLYSAAEFEVMKQDLNLFKEAGANGVVFGILTRQQDDRKTFFPFDGWYASVGPKSKTPMWLEQIAKALITNPYTCHGEVDISRCKELKELASPLPMTFHRAFDMVKDPYTSLEIIIKLGFERILTSGQDSSALEGLPTIKYLIEKAKDRIIIVPGGGITKRNLERILRASGAKEFHCSARHSVPSFMAYKNTNTFMGGVLRPPEFVNKVTSYENVKNFVFVARSVLK